jgi:hypothetical protein
LNEEGAGGLDEPTIKHFLETSYPRLVVAVALVSGTYAAAEDVGDLRSTG